MRKFSTKTPEATKALFQGYRTSHFQIFDSVPELVDFANAREIKPSAMEFADMGMTNDVTHKEAARRMIEGDLSLAAKSDALLAKFEHAEIAAGRFQMQDDVIGALPNVPAFIAGQPLNMRNRRRVADERAPIKIVVDTGAASNIETHEIEARGAAILALVRVLSISRPVELWACVGLDADNRKNATWTFVQIDTAPLDLARAAFILTHPAALRRIFWACAMEHGYKAASPYGKQQEHGPFTRELIAPAFPDADDLLVIPRARRADDSVTNPTAWLARQIEQNAIAMAA